MENFLIVVLTLVLFKLLWIVLKPLLFKEKTVKEPEKLYEAPEHIFTPPPTKTLSKKDVSIHLYEEQHLAFSCVRATVELNHVVNYEVQIDFTFNVGTMFYESFVKIPEGQKVVDIPTNHICPRQWEPDTVTVTNITY